jgi:hypothetical protein
MSVLHIFISMLKTKQVLNVYTNCNKISIMCLHSCYLHSRTPLNILLSCAGYGENLVALEQSIVSMIYIKT